MYVQSNLTEWLTWGRRKQLYFPCVFPRKHPFHTDLEESVVISKVIMIKFVNIKNKIETNLSIFPKIKYFKFNKPVVHYGQSILLYTLKGKWGLLKWLGGKESACQRRSHRRRKFNPWVGKIPWRRKWQPTPVFLPGESMDRGAWWAPVDGVTKSWTWLSAHTETNDPMLLEDGSLSWRGSLSAIHVADSLEVKFSERGLKTTLPSYTDSE